MEAVLVDLVMVVLLKLKVRVRTESRSRGWGEFLEYTVGLNWRRAIVPPTPFKERKGGKQK